MFFCLSGFLWFGLGLFVGWFFLGGGAKEGGEGGREGEGKEDKTYMGLDFLRKSWKLRSSWR